MSEVPDDIYASAAMRRLLADEMAMLLPGLQSCSGEHALMISAARQDSPPALPLLSCWTWLSVETGGYAGDVHAVDDASLPFIDQAFELVVLHHALERSEAPLLLLGEACRVLAPGGLLVATGVHPLSFWAPWMVWRSRRQRAWPRWPLQVGEWLRHENIRVDRVERAGPVVPGAASEQPSGGAARQSLGGGFVLIGRKQRSEAKLRRLRPECSQVPAAAALASGARRVSAW